MKRALSDTVVVLTVLVILIFTAFYSSESGDMPVVTLGTFLYLPYALGLTAFVVLLQVCLRQMGWSGIGEVVIPLVPLIAWMIFSRGSFEVRYWRLGYGEMLTLIGVLGLTNAWNAYRGRIVKDSAS